MKDVPSRLVLRWHISRIYEADPSRASPSRPVHPTVHRSTPRLVQALEGYGWRGLRHVEQEDRSWWDREEAVEGFVLEATLVEGLARRNALELGDLFAGPSERGLAEDMVLVQALPEEGPWHEAVAAYDGGAADLPDLTELARTEGGHWIDFTRPARGAAKTRYKRALETSAPPPEGGAPHATKR